MRGRAFRWFVVIVACCGLTAAATRWVVLARVEADSGGAVRFHRYRDALAEFARTRPLADGEQVGGDALPPALAGAGVTSVYRNGQFVYFVVPSRSFLPDDATEEFVHQLDGGPYAVEDILRTTRRVTYHIQHLPSAPVWYYWMHN